MVNKKAPKKPTKPLSLEEKEEQFWEEVNQLAQEKIYQLLTTNIPLQNIPLIKEPWCYEEAQQKKVGLFLDRDVDYRTLLVDLENQWYERVKEEGEQLPEPEYLAEEIAMFYCTMVMKSIIRDVSDYNCYDPYFFSRLTEYN